MTYYFINDKGLIQKQVGGDPPTNVYIGVSPDGIMRRVEDGRVTAAIPVPDNPLKDIIEQKNAATLLGVMLTNRVRGRRSKPKTKRKTKKCRCK